MCCCLFLWQRCWTYQYGFFFLLLFPSCLSLLIVCFVCLSTNFSLLKTNKQKEVNILNVMNNFSLSANEKGDRRRRCRRRIRRTWPCWDLFRIHAQQMWVSLTQSIFFLACDLNRLNRSGTWSLCLKYSLSETA